MSEKSLHMSGARCASVPPEMFNRFRTTSTTLGVLLVAVALSACGGSGGGKLSGDIVAQVGGSAITTGAINHWMSTLAGGDFYEITQVSAPRGVVSEPANYSRCVTALGTITHGRSAEALMTRCHELHTQLEQQAVEYLINADEEVEESAELGVTASKQQVERAFDQIKARDFPSEAEVQQYLRERDWSLPDELFLVKRDVLGPEMLTKVERKLGVSSISPAVEKFYKEDGNKWTAKTICRAGYVVEGCSEYVPPKTPTTNRSPAVIIEGLDLHPASAEHTAPDLECKNNPNVRIGSKLTCEPTTQHR